MNERILIIGASGQVGSELVVSLRKIYGETNVIASDIYPVNSKLRAHSTVIYSKKMNKRGPYIELDALDKNKIYHIIKSYKINQVYLLAAMLSAKSEKNVELAWRLNTLSLSNILLLSKEKHVKKIFWPSSIAVFGPTTPKKMTPQYTIMEPNTVYGISKLAGERWCEYYFNKFNVDVRSIRYPGLIGWKADPGGGTTDYAVDIFHQAIKDGKYDSFLSENTRLPMMYMQDAIRATIELMEAPTEQVKIRSSYNLAGVSFTPKQIAVEVSKHIPNFEITYNPDFRQAIADSWPSSIDDSYAQKNWGWELKYNLEKMTTDMIINLKKQYKITA
jgi:nucleoside-diphosphate-sugar epimerase